MNNQTFTEGNVAFEFPFQSPLQRLIMVYIQVSGSGDGGKEKVISDRKFLDICCCNSDDFISAINFLLNEGFLEKSNYGMQFGEAVNGYVITVPDKLRKGSWMR